MPSENKRLGFTSTEKGFFYLNLTRLLYYPSLALRRLGERFFFLFLIQQRMPVDCDFSHQIRRFALFEFSERKKWRGLMVLIQTCLAVSLHAHDNYYIFYLPEQQLVIMVLLFFNVRSTLISISLYYIISSFPNARLIRIIFSYTAVITNMISNSATEVICKTHVPVWFTFAFIWTNSWQHK